MHRFACFCILSLSASALSAETLLDTSEIDEVDYLATLPIEQLTSIPVTVATRTEKTLLTAPSSVSVFTGEQIRQMGMRTLEDIMQFVPGMYANRHDVFGEAPVVRGYASSSCANIVLVLLDGQRMNSSQCGGAFEALSYLNLMDVEQVEIIRGPGSAIYGSNAMAAVINIITRVDGNYVESSIGSFSKKEAGLRLTRSIGDYDVRLYARYSSDDGYSYAPFFEYFGEMPATSDPVKGADAGFQIQRGALSASANYYYRENGEFFTVGGGIGDGSGLLRLRSDNVFLRVKYTPIETEKWDLTLQGEYRYLDADFQTPLIPAELASQIVWSNGAVTPYVGGNTFKENDWRLAADGQWRPSEHARLGFGVEFRRESIGRNSFQGNFDSATYLASGGTDFIPLPEGERYVGFFGGAGLPLLESEYFLIDATARNVFGAYTQGDITLSDTLTVVVGARFDSYEEIGSSFTIRSAALYAPTPFTTLKALFGQAFRAPSIFEYYGEELATAAIGNPNLKAENLSSYELSLLQRVGPALFTVTWFNNTIKDGIQLEQIDDVINGIATFQPQNTGKLKNHGWELEAQIAITQDFRFKIGWSHVDPAVDLGVAHSTAYWIANYQVGRLNVNVSGYARGKLLSQHRNTASNLQQAYIDGFMNWNASVRYELRSGLEAFVTGRNLFDATYQNFTGASGLNGMAPMRGFSFETGLRWNF